MMKAE